ncbi:polysaccharide deacetylase family protein [Bacillus sp. Marseille-P3661]|uniref:polysaccharide deacetylase family protein n=1 Tax=Bacillus sp. Marseille-P3661 TaxID=1936234 RepID=UPI000C83661D|nr:polysaccharide deacetylase family protein [Bacillus sp. Marseille-P3661]
MKKHNIKILITLFIYSTLPLLIVNFVFPSYFLDRSASLQAKMASPIITALQEKKYTTPHSEQDDTGLKIAYLTFDDGPNLYTLEIIKTLKQKGVQATFFLLKNNINKHPSIVNSITENGNSIGCHGVSHRVDYFYASAESVVQEMRECQRTIYSISRIRSPLVRVPFGSYPYLTPQMKNALEQEGFIYWDWNIDSDDWKNNEHTILTSIKEQLTFIEEKGHTPTILLHDKQVTTKILPDIIDHLLSRGYIIKGINNYTQPVQFNRFLQPAT